MHWYWLWLHWSWLHWLWSIANRSARGDCAVTVHSQEENLLRAAGRLNGAKPKLCTTSSPCARKGEEEWQPRQRQRGQQRQHHSLGLARLAVNNGCPISHWWKIPTGNPNGGVRNGWLRFYRNGFKNARLRYVLGSGGPIFGFSVKNNAVWWYYCPNRTLLGPFPGHFRICKLLFYAGSR